MYQGYASCQIFAYVAGRGIESLDSGVSIQLAPFALKLPHGEECAVKYSYILRADVTRGYGTALDLVYYESDTIFTQRMKSAGT